MVLVGTTALVYVIGRELWQDVHKSGPWAPKPVNRDTPPPRPGTVSGPSLYLYPPPWSATPPDRDGYFESMSLVG